jgi:hypothetical protein
MELSIWKGKVLIILKRRYGVVGGGTCVYLLVSATAREGGRTSTGDMHRYCGR